MTEAALYVGIDVSNASLDVCFLSSDARTVRQPGTYSNDPEGWTALRAAVISASRLVGEQPRVVCGMESTSNMHKGIEGALRKETRRSIEVHVLNPLAVKHFGKALLRSAKTDRLDSHLIALFLLRMQPEPTAEMPDLCEELKEATRTRRRMVEERTRGKNRLHKLMRRHFPGYRTVLGKNVSKRLLVVLSDMPSPHALLECPVDDLAAIRHGRGRRPGRRRLLPAPAHRRFPSTADRAVATHPDADPHHSSESPGAHRPVGRV